VTVSVNGRMPVLVAADGAAWEADALQRLSAAGPNIMLLKRCVDLNDLLATAATGQAAVALLAHGLAGFDGECVDLLRRSGVGVVVVTDRGGPNPEEEARLRRLGVDHVIDGGSLDTLHETVVAAGEDTVGTAPVHEEPGPPDPTSPAAGAGRLVTVWGPTGAPGRTTVAVGLAAELASRDLETFLLDVDGFGGAVAQHLGVLDAMSGLLAAARLANAGQLDADRLAGLARTVTGCLRVLTGLPRADRWSEVRDPAFGQLLELSRSLARYVVLDTSFCVEEDPAAAFGGGAPQRNGMTLAALEQADEVVVVGSADPVGLARLARALVDLLEAVPGCALRVAVNRARPALGWGEPEVRAMIEGFVTPLSVHFLPDDRSAADRALVAGKCLTELGDSPLRRAVAQLADAVSGETAAGRPRPRQRRLRRRR
jgi:MinD-like ATPase involved in chromosome partitioning or flagellar assembly